MGASDSKPIKKQQKIKEFFDQLEKNKPRISEPAILSAGKFRAGSRDEGKKPHIKINSPASNSDPTELIKAHARKSSIMDLKTTKAMLVNPSTLLYPFENLVFEGGGAKGMGYVGALKCLEDLGIIHQIKRFGGSSVGSITAALMAVGYTSEDLLAFTNQDVESVVLDHSCGLFSLVPNIIRKFGWNPGVKIYEWFGKVIKEQTGDPDTTFHDLYKMRGVELCIVVTNLSLMSSQYCHVKTTPNMPIRDALRMSITVPGVFTAVNYDLNGGTDVFVDGGVLVNFPINCFDGWYLSMAQEDAFLAKLKSVDDFPVIMTHSSRFDSTGPNKTIGLSLFADNERVLMRFTLEGRLGAIMPERPETDTKLWLKSQQKKEEEEKAERFQRRIMRSLDNFLKVLSKVNVDDLENISKEELHAAFDHKDFQQHHRELLFGTDCNIDEIFEMMDTNGDNDISFFELIQYLEQRGIRLQTRFHGYHRREVSTLGDFLVALQETMMLNLKQATVRENDADRIVGINTGHVGWMDFNLEDADADFVIERGYNATMSFLRYYASKYPSQVKDLENERTATSQKRASVQSILSDESNSSYIDINGSPARDLNMNG